MRLIDGQSRTEPRTRSDYWMTNIRIARRAIVGLVAAGVFAASCDQAQAPSSGGSPGAEEEPVSVMPPIAPIGVRIDKYLDVPASARGPAIDPAKGYRLQDLAKGCNMVTDNLVQSMAP